MANSVIRGKIYPIKNNVLVAEMNFGERTTKAGLLLPGDNMEQRGIRPRWGKVVAVGPDQLDVEEGEWILIDHGRWTRGIDLIDPTTGTSTTVRLVDPKDIFIASDQLPEDGTVRDKIGPA
jgi:co-chaperonin GroES (HSP10)